MTTIIRSLFTLAILALGHCAWAQDEVLTNNVGTKLGKRSSFLERCRRHWASDKELHVFDRDRFCDCMVPLVLKAPAVAQNDNPRILQLVNLSVLLSNSPTAMSELMGCAQMDVSGIRLRSLEAPDRERMRLTMAAEMRKQPALNGYDVDRLCGCVMEAIIQRDLTIGDLQAALDQNSPLFNEVLLPCVTQASPSSLNDTVVSSSSALGPEGPVRVETIPFGKVHKVKVRSGLQDHYFVIDSGAEDCMISRSLVLDLIRAGAIDTTERLVPKLYMFADGTRMELQRYIVQGMEVGPFRVERVVVAAVNGNVPFLLGKSFLNRFARWHIDETDDTLTLER